MDHNCHILSISETWLKPNMLDGLVYIEGNFFIRNDRKCCMGGGVACYISNVLKTTILSQSTNAILNEPEFIIFNVSHLSQFNILIASVYRRPKGILFNLFLNEFDEFYPNATDVIIMGDLNCDLLSQSFEANYLRTMATSHALHILQFGPTHHTALTDSWLDIFLVNELDKIVQIEKTDSPFIAGHDLLSIQYKLSTSST